MARQSWRSGRCLAVGSGAIERDQAFATARGLSIAVRIGRRVEIRGYAAADLVPRGGAERCF